MQGMLDFNFLPRLQPAELNVYEDLESAFDCLLEVLRLHDGRQVVGSEALREQVAGAVRRIWAVLDSAAPDRRALRALTMCQPEGQCGHDARQLLCLGEHATAENIGLVLTRGGGVLLDEYPWHALRMRVGEVKQALLAALAPPGLAELTEAIAPVERLLQAAGAGAARAADGVGAALAQAVAQTERRLEELARRLPGWSPGVKKEASSSSSWPTNTAGLLAILAG
jgi:hypothetical protein